MNKDILLVAAISIVFGVAVYWTVEAIKQFIGDL